mmetsp:Transcript_69783/g.202493  ORF Transcript_69783/g.202493 Transcript_69783/m.202493 type:complete len:340 (+) Transcript_69783:1-1020(+)
MRGKEDFARTSCVVRSRHHTPSLYRRRVHSNRSGQLAHRRPSSRPRRPERRRLREPRGGGGHLAALPKFAARAPAVRDKSGGLQDACSGWSLGGIDHEHGLHEVPQVCLLSLSPTLAQHLLQAPLRRPQSLESAQSILAHREVARSRSVQLPHIQGAAPEQRRRQPACEATKAHRLREDDLRRVRLVAPHEAAAMQLAQGDRRAPHVAHVGDGEAKGHLWRPFAEMTGTSFGQAPISADRLYSAVEAGAAKVDDLHARDRRARATRIRHLGPYEVVRLHVVVDHPCLIKDDQASQGAEGHMPKILHRFEEGGVILRYLQAVPTLHEGLDGEAHDIVEGV